MSFYAVANGKNIGIFSSWDECKASVNGYKNATYKKFDKREAAEAFMNENSGESTKAFIYENSGESIPTVKSDSHPEFTPDYYVYTDGACSNNGKENAIAGIGIFFGTDDPRNLSQKIEGKQTNNAAELTAIIKTYPIIEADVREGKKIVIMTDSEYAIKCISTYGEKCYNQNWKKDIPNKELVKLAYERYKDWPNIRFIHIRAHTEKTDIHSIGNDGADKLANASIGLESCPYNTSK
jgi:ribonuclease HI